MRIDAVHEPHDDEESRMNFTSKSIAVLGAAICTTSVMAGSATFQLLTTQNAADVTVDEFGRTLVATTDGGSVFIYEDGNYSFLGAGASGRDISADGSTVPGTGFNSDDVEEAIRWFAAGGSELLGSLPNALTCPSVSSGYAASADGEVIAGLSWDGCNGRAFRWTQATGMVEMQAQGDGRCRASVISDNGQILAGFCQGNFSRSPAAWNADGTPYGPWSFDPDVQGEIGAMSSDGSILAGRYFDENTPGPSLLPFYWTQSEGIVILPTVAGFSGGYVLDVSDDNRTKVGYAGTPTTGITAALWRDEWGAVDLKTQLNALGANVPDNFDPLFARGVTNDGETVVGWGFLGPDMPGELGSNRAFIATLPPAETLPCPPDLNGDNTVGFADLTQLLNAWGPCPGCDEDLDDNDQVGFSDLTIMLNAWGPCP